MCGRDRRHFDPIVDHEQVRRRSDEIQNIGFSMGRTWLWFSDRVAGLCRNIDNQLRGFHQPSTFLNVGVKGGAICTFQSSKYEHYKV